MLGVSFGSIVALDMATAERGDRSKGAISELSSTTNSSEMDFATDEKTAGSRVSGGYENEEEHCCPVGVNRFL